MFTLYTLTPRLVGVNMHDMALTRAAYHHGDLRNALVASAVSLIEQGGLSAFSLRAAARDVGVSANAAYRHFNDKAHIVAAAAARGFEQLSNAMHVAMARAGNLPGETPLAIERFKAVGRAYVAFALAHPELFRLMFGDRGDGCPGTDLDRRGDRGRPWELLGGSLDALCAEGWLNLERRQGAELKAWTVVHGFASLVLGGHFDVSSEQERAAALESLLEFVVMGLCLEVSPRAAR